MKQELQKFKSILRGHGEGAWVGNFSPRAGHCPTVWSVVQAAVCTTLVFQQVRVQFEITDVDHWFLRVFPRKSDGFAELKFHGGIGTAEFVQG